MTRLTAKEKCERATDLIGMLAGFGTNYEDARQIGSVMYRQLTEMSPAEYEKLGAGVGTVAALLDSRDGIDRNKFKGNVLRIVPDAEASEYGVPDPATRARIFHEPEEN